jgi:hypothetical protein
MVGHIRHRVCCVLLLLLLGPGRNLEHPFESKTRLMGSGFTSHSMSSRQVAKASALPHWPAPVSVVSFFTPTGQPEYRVLCVMDAQSQPVSAPTCRPHNHTHDCATHDCARHAQALPTLAMVQHKWRLTAKLALTLQLVVVRLGHRCVGLVAASWAHTLIPS